MVRVCLSGCVEQGLQIGNSTLYVYSGRYFVWNREALKKGPVRGKFRQANRPWNSDTRATKWWLTSCRNSDNMGTFRNSDIPSFEIQMEDMDNPPYRALENSWCPYPETGSGLLYASSTHPWCSGEGQLTSRYHPCPTQTQIFSSCEKSMIISPSTHSKHLHVNPVSHLTG